jgi:hypothetical protein
MSKDTITVKEMCREVELSLGQLHSDLFGLREEAKRQNRFADSYVLNSLHEKLNVTFGTFTSIQFATNENAKTLKKLYDEKEDNTKED